jgi:hypothetical protein
MLKLNRNTCANVVRDVLPYFLHMGSDISTCLVLSLFLSLKSDGIRRYFPPKLRQLLPHVAYATIEHIYILLALSRNSKMKTAGSYI